MIFRILLSSFANWWWIFYEVSSRKAWVFNLIWSPKLPRKRLVTLTYCLWISNGFWLMCSDRTLHAPQFTCCRCYVQMCWLKQLVQTRNGRAGELIQQFLQKDKEGMKINDICFILYIPLIIKHFTMFLRPMQTEVYTQSTAGFWKVLSLFILCTKRA